MVYLKKKKKKRLSTLATLVLNSQIHYKRPSGVFGMKLAKSAECVISKEHFPTSIGCKNCNN